jgi:hypothetical protein
MTGEAITTEKLPSSGLFAGPGKLSPGPDQLGQATVPSAELMRKMPTTPLASVWLVGRTLFLWATLLFISRFLY